MAKSPTNINAQAMMGTPTKMEVSGPIPQTQLTLFEQNLTAVEKEELKKQLATNNPLLTKLFVAIKHAEDNMKVLQNNLHMSELQKNELQFAYEQSNSKMAPVLSKIKEVLVCPICRDPSVLPKVIAKCGHSICEQCVKQIDEVAFNELASQNTISAAEHLQKKRCPMCRSKMIGSGLPNLALKEIACVSINAGLIEFEDPNLQIAFKKKFLDNSIQFETQTEDTNHVEAVQIASYASSQIAEICAKSILENKKISRHDWINGIYVLCDPFTNKIFFEIFAKFLSGKTHSNKPGTIAVLANRDDRILAIQLIATEKEDVELSKQKKPHILIKIEGCSGRYSIGGLPNNPTNPNSSSRPLSGQALSVSTFILPLAQASAPIPASGPVFPRMQASSIPASATVFPRMQASAPIPVPPVETRAFVSAPPASAVAAVRVAAVYAAAARASATPQNVARQGNKLTGS